jgi:hypothetical protein
MILMLSMSLLLLLFGGLLLSVGLVFMRKNAGFNRRAVQVDGTVVGHREQYSTSRAVHRRIHFPKVRYTVEGREHEAHAPGGDEPQPLGTRLALLVDPVHPEQVSFTGPRGGAGVAGALAAGGCLSALLGLGLLGTLVALAFTVA